MKILLIILNLELKTFIINHDDMDHEITFYKSLKSERWWMEINFSHNNMDKSSLIPCTYQDYLTANNQILPERWLKTFRKLN